MDGMNPFNLDWGTATVELVSDESYEAIHIFNHNLEQADFRERTERFVAGRVKWFALHLPEDMRQSLCFDDRGQNLSINDRQAFAKALSSISPSIHFLSQGKRK